MKKYSSKLGYVLVAVVLAIILYQVKINRSSDQQKNIHENLQSLETDKSSLNEEWINNLYRNNKYKFRIEFPKNWEYLPGSGKHILAKAVNRKIGATMSALVVENTVKTNDPNDIWKNQSENAFRSDILGSLAMQNIIPDTLEIEKGSLNNFNAYIVTCTYLHKMGASEYIYFNVFTQCHFENRTYQVGFNIPIDYFDEETATILNRAINSFQFEVGF